MHCAAIVANVPRKKHLRALRHDYCTIVAEKSCAHCAAIIVQYDREKVVRIVPRAEKIFPTYFSISLQDFLTINPCSQSYSTVPLLLHSGVLIL